MKKAIAIALVSSVEATKLSAKAKTEAKTESKAEAEFFFGGFPQSQMPMSQPMPMGAPMMQQMPYGPQRFGQANQMRMQRQQPHKPQMLGEDNSKDNNPQEHLKNSMDTALACATCAQASLSLAL